ncbi:MAG: lysozyme inhibitor LprI family protein [Peptostreptococcaceae bacterium]
MKKILLLALSVLLLVGCSNSTFEKSVEEAKLAIASQEYEKAEGLFNLALEEKSNDKEIKSLFEQTQKLVEAKKLEQNKQYNEVVLLCEEIEKIPSKSDVVISQAKKIKEEAVKLKDSEVEEKKEEVVEKQDNEVVNKETNNKSVLLAKRDLYIQKLSELEIKLENEYEYVYVNGSNSDMIEAEYEQYVEWDYMLNEIYGEIKKYLPEDEMNKLKNIQRKWITERDKSAEDASKEFEGGTGAPLAYNSVLSEKTKERCYELVDGYMK